MRSHGGLLRTLRVLKENCLLGTSIVGCSVVQMCLTLSDPMNCSPQGSLVHGTSQARILEWVAFSRNLHYPPQITAPDQLVERRQKFKEIERKLYDHAPPPHCKFPA